MKPKTGFESGSSPTVSQNGAGRGLEETRRKIVEAFEKARQHLQATQPPTPQPPTLQVYTEQNEVRFRTRAEKLASVALSSSPIRETRGGVIEIVVPRGSAEELIAEAMRGFECKRK